MAMITEVSEVLVDQLGWVVKRDGGWDGMVVVKGWRLEYSTGCQWDCKCERSCRKRVME